MLIPKFKWNLLCKNYLLSFIRTANRGPCIDKFPQKETAVSEQKGDKCNQKKSCNIPTSETVPSSVKDKKDVCVFHPCPKPPCEIEPCKADVPTPEVLAYPEDGFPAKTDASIVVIGAGVAGLSCAQRLVTGGYKNTVILEAEDRPGGRISSGWLRDTVIEKGSNWCCETSNPFKNHIVQLGVKMGQFNIPLSGVDPSQGLLLQSDCTPLPLPISYMAYSHLSDILKEASCIRENAPITESDLADSYVGVRVNQLLKKLPSDMAMTCAKILLGISSYLNRSYPKLVSDSFATYATAANMRIPLGYVGALAPLIFDITPDRIFYSKQVLSICWGTVVPEQHPRAVIRCRDGTTYTADYVVVTSSLGVLKHNLHMFCPPLSPAKTHAIKKMNTGFIGKVFMEYEQPFWVWRDNKICGRWGESELCKRSNFTRGMTSLEESCGSEHVIAVTIKGQQAVEEMEKLTDMETVTYLTDFLKEWLGDTSIPMPIKIIKTNWSMNPNFRAAYSYLEEDDTDHELNLADSLMCPLPRDCCELPPVLFFAGEHTCPAPLMGTVRGAMVSGVREAERVISAINRSKFVPHPCEELVSAVC